MTCQCGKTIKVSNTAFTSQSQVSSGSRQSRPAQVKSTKDQLFQFLFLFFQDNNLVTRTGKEVGAGGVNQLKQADADENICPHIYTSELVYAVFSQASKAEEEKLLQ